MLHVVSNPTHQVSGYPATPVFVIHEQKGKYSTIKSPSPLRICASNPQLREPNAYNKSIDYDFIDAAGGYLHEKRTLWEITTSEKQWEAVQ
jgi:hypothetical protein